MERKIGKLSNTQVSMYQQCPKLWYISYVLKIRAPERPQPMCFGIALHEGMEALCHVWKEKEDAVVTAKQVFEKSYRVGDGKGPNPEYWVAIGNRLIDNFDHKLQEMNFVPLTSEQRMSNEHYIGVVDCIGMVNGVRTVIDWKTASSPYSTKDVETSDQLTGYAWLTGCNQVAFCVGVKKTGEVYWYSTTRSPQQVSEYEDRILVLRHKLATTSEFPGKHTRKACMAWNRKCDAWALGACCGLDDF